MDDVGLKLFPQFKGRYFQATEFVTSVRVTVASYRLLQVDAQSKAEARLVRVDGIALSVDKVERKVLEARNYATTNQVVMEVG